MNEGNELEVRRTFRAPPEAVFEAFRNPELLKEWASPGEHRTESMEMDFREGGSYRREMRFPDGSLHLLTGTYLEIDPPRRLVYTYLWETIPGAPSTRVEIELTPTDEGTDLRLIHSGFEDEGMAGDHRSGWEVCFDQLAELLEE